MAKKIRFSLDMGQDILVSTLEDLQENFNLEKVKEYFFDGRLLTWLEDRYYEDEAEAIEELDKNDYQLGKKLCEIFDVEYDESQDSSLELMEKINTLKQYTDDEEILAHAAQVAFNQEELADLLDEGTETIYLCGTKFNIPARKTGIEYIGVNRPVVKVKLREGVKLSDLDIKFQNVEFEDKELNKTTEKTEEIVEKQSITEMDVLSNLFYEMFIENGSEVQALCILHKDGTEERISQGNKGKHVIDYCESAKYIFYAMKSKLEKNDQKSNFTSIFTSFANREIEEKAEIFRFDKESRRTEKIIGDMDIEVRMDAGRGSFVDSNDISRTNGKWTGRTMFCSDNKLVFKTRSRNLYTTNFDGKEMKKLILVDEETDRWLGIGWIYKDLLFYEWSRSINNYLWYEIYCYNLKTRETYQIAEDSWIMFTDGNKVYFPETHRKRGNVIFYCMDIDGKNKIKLGESTIRKDNTIGYIEEKENKVQFFDGNKKFVAEFDKVN